MPYSTSVISSSSLFSSSLTKGGDLFNNTQLGILNYIKKNIFSNTYLHNYDFQKFLYILKNVISSEQTNPKPSYILIAYFFMLFVKRQGLDQVNLSFNKEN